MNHCLIDFKMSILYIWDMNILAVDTSTLKLGIGVITGSGESFSQRWSEEGHSARLFGRIEFAIERVGLDKGDIDLLGVVSGPGSFTGLRIGMAGLLGWAVATGLPIQPVDSFAAMKASVPDTMYPLLIVIHSRGDDFYMQYLAASATTEDAAPFVGSTDSLGDLPSDKCTLCGPGSERLSDMLSDDGKNRFQSAGSDYSEPDMIAVCTVAARLFSERAEPRDDYKIEPYYMTLSQAQINFEQRERRL